ncbi:unnamed protein product [Orchesella dallaii]|uniref:C-type lectin domain-containing protein n=1 Tax=Orchesella dallaii TaxID=48710 RepID=A0ABP1PLI5_9HEXA
MCNKIIFILIFAFLLKGGKTNPDNLVVLGTVEGKSYFAIGVRELFLTYFDWTASKSYCEEKGLKLATIDTEAEAQFLKSAYDPVEFNGWYWVAAKYRRPGGWSWVETGKKVEVFSSLQWQSMRITANLPEYCLCYSSNLHNTGYYFKRECYHLHHVLCETSKPIETFSNLIPKKIKPEPKMIDIGTLNGITYYGDKVLRNWTESRSFCLNNGMQLATIRSQAQGPFLRDACFKINFDGYFWVLGKVGEIKEPSDGKCPNYKPHHSSFLYKMCPTKYFTLCESATSLTDSSFDPESEEEDFEEGIKEEELAEEKFKENAVYKSDKGSYAIFITIIVLLIVVIVCLLIWKTKLWTRIYPQNMYFSVTQIRSGNADNRSDASGIELVIGD